LLGYDTNDPTARQLAERVIALAGSSPRPEWIPAELSRAGAPDLRVLAVSTDSIADDLAAGRIAGAIAGYERDGWAACPTRALAYDGRPGIPLIDSRAHVLVRRGSGARFYIAHDGTLWFTDGRIR
jgi:hypothetical protein